MIVIMRDAVMPDCCKTCVCSEGYGCGITGTEMTTKEMESRPNWCPLEEVEPCEDAVSREAISKWLKQYGQDVLHGKYKFSLMYIWKNLMDLPSAQPEQRWIPCSELPSDNREVEVTCEVRRCDGKRYRYTCHASYVHKYTIESTDYCDWEEADEYNEDEDKYYALPGWYERVHNWDDYSFIAIADFVTAWRELPEPYKEEGEKR